MFRDLDPELPWTARKLLEASESETKNGTYSVKPGSVLFDRTLWRHNAAGERYDAFGDVGNCDMVLVMGTSLSGLTIDDLAHSAGRLKKRRIVFDMFDTPVQSIKCNGPWNPEHDSFVQGPIDISILQILRHLNWISQLFDDTHYLDQLCLNSLNALKDDVMQHPEEATPHYVSMLDTAIAKETERESYFYPDDADCSKNKQRRETHSAAVSAASGDDATETC